MSNTMQLFRSVFDEQEQTEVLLGMASDLTPLLFDNIAVIPRFVMESSRYIKLSFAAKCLLYEFAFQYRGHNNGALTAAFHVLKERGWKSRTTIERARDELIEANLIIKTREGKFLNPGGVCALYAILWEQIDGTTKVTDRCRKPQ